MIKLSPRMMMAAQLVRPGRCVCDIGTDHAYLPAYLVLNGISPSALACDIGKGPLENARKSVEAYGIADKIELRLSDGLDEICEDEAQEFVFCGMGGTLMAELIGRCSWLKNSDKHIVVQPMSHIDDIRRYFIENGFEIENECVCVDSGHIYAAASAYYTGERKDYPPGYVYYGKLAENADSLSLLYIEKQLLRLIKHSKGIENNPDLREEYIQLQAIISDITEVLSNAEG